MNTSLTRKDFLRSCSLSLAGILLAGSSMAAEQRARFEGVRENLIYNNPFGQKVKTSWYNGKKVQHLSLSAVTQRPPFKIAEQYNLIYADQYHGPTGTVEKFEAQEEKTVGYAIFDSAPGDKNYSPIWHINWVIAPHSYKANTITSARAVEQSGFKIIPANIWEN